MDVRLMAVAPTVHDESEPLSSSRSERCGALQDCPVDVPMTLRLFVSFSSLVGVEPC